MVSEEFWYIKQKGFTQCLEGAVRLPSLTPSFLLPASPSRPRLAILAMLVKKKGKREKQKKKQKGAVTEQPPKERGATLPCLRVMYSIL